MVMAWCGMARYGMARHGLTVRQDWIGLNHPREAVQLSPCLHSSGERSWPTRVASSVTKVVVRHRQPSRREGRIKAQAKQEAQKLA